MEDLSRREFMAVGAMSLTAGAGEMPVQQVAIPDQLVETAESEGFVAAPILFGALEDRPEAGDDFFDGKTGVYVYQTDGSGGGSGEIYWIAVDHGDVISGWNILFTAVQLARYGQASLPTDVKNGFLVFDTNRGLPAWWDRDHYEWPSFVDNQDVLLTPQTVANTTTQTEVFNIDINADSLIQGRVYQLDLMGTFGTANTSDQYTVIIELGGTEIATLQNDPENATNAPWSMETTMTVRSHGENGQVQPHSRGVFNSVTTDDHHPTATVDTTVVEMLSVDILWEAADPENTVTLGQAHLKEMA